MFCINVLLNFSKQPEYVMKIGF